MNTKRCAPARAQGLSGVARIGVSVLRRRGAELSPATLAAAVALTACTPEVHMDLGHGAGASSSAGSSGSRGSGGEGASSAATTSSGAGGAPAGSTVTSSAGTGGSGTSGTASSSSGAGGSGTSSTAASSSGAGGVCVPGAAQPCYDGPAGTEGIGACQGGTTICNAGGTAWGPCTGEVLPLAQEDCATPVDDNCDGQVNGASEGCVCTPGAPRSCYDGPAGTAGVGICVAGVSTCDADGRGFGPCTGEVLPLAQEDCATPVDDNCNGQANEGCVCVPGATQPCYDGPMGTAGVGICAAGAQTCAGDGQSWGACTGEVLPLPQEDCATPVDDDCDGQVNGVSEGCVCAPGTTSACYDGPAGTEGVGICVGGIHACSPDGRSFGPCTGEVLPLPKESCATPVDDNCNGKVNEVCMYSDCKSVLAANPGSASGLYQIQTGTGILTAYCDMTTAGGGWTLVGRSKPGGNTLGCVGTDGGTNFGWSSGHGNAADDTQPYSLDVVKAGLQFTDILFGSYTTGKTWGGAFRQTVGATFVTLYATVDHDYGPPTAVLGTCSQNTTMFSFIGYTNDTDVFHFRDMGGNGYGLSSSGWLACYTNCAQGGGLDQQPGMIFVR